MLGMLSAKNIRAHGMKDEKWTIRDKTNQFKGILKLHEREKKFQAQNAIQKQKKLSKDLKQLKKDVSEYRIILRDALDGDKRHFQQILQAHKEYQRCLEYLTPQQVRDKIYEDCAAGRKQLDKLRYERKKKMKQFCDLKLESDYLVTKIELEKEEFRTNKQQQELVSSFQNSLAKFNVAKSIRVVYLETVDILKKDAVYFDSVLNALKDDRKEQSNVIYKATTIGQLAAESLDDTRNKYKKMAHDVWVNMKEREQNLDLVRHQVTDLWSYAQSLVRIESDQNLLDQVKPVSQKETALEKQLKELEGTMTLMKKEFKVNSYDEIVKRIEDQMTLKARLLDQYQKNLALRNSYLNKKNHAELILVELEHSTISTTGQYKSEKRRLMEQMAIYQQQEKDCIRERKVTGELLMNIRAALQSLAMTLSCVDVKYAKVPGKPISKRKESAISERSVSKVIEETDDDDIKKFIETGDKTQLIKVESDAQKLLTEVSQKIHILMSMANFDIDKEQEERAKDMYETYIADQKAQLKFNALDKEQSGLFVEHEIIDPTVLSRAEIKMRSKQIVEAHLNKD